MALSLNLSRRNWFSHPEIRALSPEERGVYLDLLVLANESPTRGMISFTDADLAQMLSVTTELVARTKNRLVELRLACVDGEGRFFFPEIVSRELARQKRREAMAARKPIPSPQKSHEELAQRVSKIEETLSHISKSIERLCQQVERLRKRSRRKRKAHHSGNGHHSLLEDANPSSTTPSSDIIEQLAEEKRRIEKEELAAAVPKPDPLSAEELEKKRQELISAFQAIEQNTHTPEQEPPPDQSGASVEDSAPKEKKWNIPSWLGDVDPEIYEALMQTRYADLLVEPESPPWPQPDKEPVQAFLKYRHRGPWTIDTYIAYAKLPEVAEALAKGDPIGFPGGGYVTKEMPCYRFPEQWSIADTVVSYRVRAWKDDLVIPFHPLVDPPRPDYDQRPIIDRRPLTERPYILEVLKELRAKGKIRPLVKSSSRPKRDSGSGVERLFPDIPPKSTKLKSTPIVEADPDDTSEEFLVFPTRGDSQFWRIRNDFVDKLQERYEGLDVRSELVKALTWVEAHQSRRKTARGMLKFLVGWLNRASQRVQSLASGERPRDYRIDGYPCIRHPDDVKYSIY